MVGKTVRVELEDSRSSEHYGEHGTCIQVEEGEKEEEQQATVMSEEKIFKVAVRSLVQRQETELKKRKELKTFRGQSEIQKQLLLMMSGYGWAPEREEPIDSVTQKSPECFESQQVKIWCGLTQWSIQPKSVVVYDPDYVQVLTNTAHGAVEPDRPGVRSC